MTMNIKKIYLLITVLAVGTVSTSCRAWLSVDSEDRIMEDELFKDTDGFYTALNGIYVDLVNANLYSGTFGPSSPDVLAQYYDTEADNHTFGSLALYQNEAKRLAVSNAWTRAYLMILNANKILEHCETASGTILNVTDYNIIKGECLGLRALLHFELFRYFGPVYTVSPGADAIPYMDVSDPQVMPVLKATEAAERILDDLDKAASLLGESDPVITLGKNETDNGGRNLYGYRNLRLNYFAVKALAARVNMYLGYGNNREEALRLAEEVISEAGKFFPFSTRDEVTGQAAIGAVTESAEDRILSSDVLFAVYNVRRGEDIYEKYFSNSLEATNLLAISGNGYRNMYPEEGDLRTYQWESTKDVLGNDIMSFVKYEAMEVDGKNYPYMIPVIRMSEMYLIAAECYADEENSELAYARLNAVRNARMTSSVSSNIKSNIENEYVREFAGEGQLFWYYKRNNMPSVPALYDRSRPNITVSTANYVFELPQSEDGFRD